MQGLHRPRCQEIVVLLSHLLSQQPMDAAGVHVKEEEILADGETESSHAVDVPPGIVHDEAQVLISSVLRSSFDSEEIQEALRPGVPRHEWALEQSGNRICDSSLSDLYTARMCDNLRQGSATPMSDTASEHHDEILQRLQRILQRSEEQATQLGAHRQEAVAARYLFQVVCEQAVADRQRASYMAAQITSFSKMLHALGRAFVEEKRMSDRRLDDMRIGWQDSIDQLQALEDQLLHQQALADAHTSNLCAIDVDQSHLQQSDEKPEDEDVKTPCDTIESVPGVDHEKMCQLMRIRLSLDFDEVGKDGTDAREQFEETLCMDLAHASNLTAENFLVLAMTRGSVVVDVEILHHHHIDGDWNPCDVLEDLLLQAKTGSSKLLQGTLTRRTESLTAVCKSTDLTEAWVEFDQAEVSPVAESVNQQEEIKIDTSVGMAERQKKASHEPAQQSQISPSKPGGLAYTLELDFGKQNAGQEERADTSRYDSESLLNAGNPAQPAAAQGGADEEPKPIRQRPVDLAQLAAAKRLISVALPSCFLVCTRVVHGPKSTPG